MQNTGRMADGWSCPQHASENTCWLGSEVNRNCLIGINKGSQGGFTEESRARAGDGLGITRRRRRRRSFSNVAVAAVFVAALPCGKAFVAPGPQAGATVGNGINVGPGQWAAVCGAGKRAGRRRCATVGGIHMVSRTSSLLGTLI